MAKNLIHPFHNETETVQLGDLTVENRLDRVSIYGSVDITRDKEGLRLVRELQQLLGLIQAELAAADLPDRVALDAVEIVKNPFE